VIETLMQLAELVQKMRSAQKAYFKTRSAESLEESKRLEREVDLEVAMIKDKQDRLF